MSERFKCIKCGLEVQGRETVTGEIRAYDRGRELDEGNPPRNMTCARCLNPTSASRLPEVVELSKEG